MSHHLFDCWSLLSIKLHHGLDEVFELLGEIVHGPLFVLAVGAPENVKSICGDATIEWVDWLSSREWRMLSNHNEKDDG